MIDTHSHIYLKEFDIDREDTVARAIAAGVSHVILPNVDIETIQQMHSLHQQLPNSTSMAMGLHPTSVDEHYNKNLQIIIEQFEQNNYIAVGEIGMDLYWDKKFKTEQAIVLTEQLRLANRLNLPVIIHCREALDEILQVFDDFDEELPPGVFHSFTGTTTDVDQIRKRGDFYFGINGIVTFKKAEIQNTIAHIGLNRILLETDSPYLAPVPYRGKRNESSYIPMIASKIAELLSTTIENIATETNKNARTLFSI